MRWGWAKKDGSTGSQWIQGTPLAPAPLVLPVKPPSQCLHVRLRSVCRSLVALPHGETCPTIHQLGEVTPSHAPTDAFSASTEFSMPHPPTPSHEFHGELRGEIEWVEGAEFSPTPIFFSSHNPVFRLSKPSTTRGEATGCAQMLGPGPNTTPDSHAQESSFQLPFFILGPRNLTLFSRDRADGWLESKVWVTTARVSGTAKFKL